MNAIYDGCKLLNTLVVLNLYRKGYISASDLKCVFSLLGETVSDEEIQSKFHFDGIVFVG